MPLPFLVRIGQGIGAAPPLSFPSSSSFPPSPNPTRKEGVLFPVGVGLPPWPPSRPAASSPWLLLSLLDQGVGDITGLYVC